jgi:monoterpene epsilon-lactone hydrolase
VRNSYIYFVALVAVCAVLSSTMWSQRQGGQRSVTINPDGSVVVANAVVPLPALMTEGSRQVLMRTKPTEGPGAPVPVPSDISDMAEVRRVYNENLRPVVNHMREVFPVDIEETTIDGISAAIITPKGGVPERNKNRLFLNGPGGGFRTGVRGNGLLISIPVAATMGVKVVSIVYRQGPEYRFPAASEDLMKVWNHYTKTYKPQNIGMVGCSAGGSLVSQTTAMLIWEGRPTPGVLGVYCAGLGASGSGDSQFFSALSVTNVPSGKAQRAGPPGPVPSPAVPVAGGGPNYYTGVDMNQFIVNPTLDEKLLAKFPPTIFFTGTRDFAMSASAYSHRKLLKAGVDSELMIFDGLYHGFMTNPDFPEAQEGYQIAAKFYDRHLGK